MIRKLAPIVEPTEEELWQWHRLLLSLYDYALTSDLTTDKEDEMLIRIAGFIRAQAEDK